MNITATDLIQLAVNWFPFLAVIGIWLFFFRQMQKRGGVYANQKRSADALERIADALEKRG